MERANMDARERKQFDKIINDVKTGQNVGTLLALLAGSGSLYLRHSRHRALFKKIAKRFPNAQSMYDFMEKNNIHPQGLVPDMDDYLYARWIQNVILKKNRISRILLNVLFAPTMLIPNAVRRYNVSRDTPEEIVYKQLGGNKKYNSYIAK
jgi:hypothetical protein